MSSLMKQIAPFLSGTPLQNLSFGYVTFPWWIGVIKGIVSVKIFFHDHCAVDIIIIAGLELAKNFCLVVTAFIVTLLLNYLVIFGLILTHHFLFHTVIVNLNMTAKFHFILYEKNDMQNFCWQKCWRKGTNEPRA